MRLLEHILVEVGIIMGTILCLERYCRHGALCIALLLCMSDSPLSQ